MGTCIFPGHESRPGHPHNVDLPCGARNQTRLAGADRVRLQASCVLSKAAWAPVYPTGGEIFFTLSFLRGGFGGRLRSSSSDLSVRILRSLSRGGVTGLASRRSRRGFSGAGSTTGSSAGSGARATADSAGGAGASDLPKPTQYAPAPSARRATPADAIFVRFPVFMRKPPKDRAPAPCCLVWG